MRHCKRTIAFLLTFLAVLTGTSAGARNLPTEMFGVEFGETHLEQAAEMLQQQGWTPRTKDSETIPGCKYIFINAKQQPITQWGQNWTTVMYVAMDASTMPVNEAFVSTGFMSRPKAETIFNEVATTLNASYGRFCTKNSSTMKVYRQEPYYLKLTLQQSTKQGVWYVVIQTGKTMEESGEAPVSH